MESLMASWLAVGLERSSRTRVLEREVRVFSWYFDCSGDLSILATLRIAPGPSILATLRTIRSSLSFVGAV